MRGEGEDEGGFDLISASVCEARFFGKKGGESVSSFKCTLLYPLCLTLDGIVSLVMVVRGRGGGEEYLGNCCV